MTVGQLPEPNNLDLAGRGRRFVNYWPVDIGAPPRVGYWPALPGILGGLGPSIYFFLTPPLDQGSGLSGVVDG